MYFTLTDFACRCSICREECVNLSRMLLENVAAVQNLTVHHGVHACASVCRSAERIQQIARRIRVRHAHRQHGAGQHERLVEMRQQVGEQRGGVRKRIRAVREHKAVEFLTVLPDRLCHALTVGGGHVGRVQLHEIERFNCAQRRQFGQCAEQCGAVQSGGKTVCGLTACNRAAGGDH